MQASNEGPDKLRLAADAPSGYVRETPASGDATASLEGRLVRRLLRVYGDPRVQIVLWTGESISTCAAPPLASVRIADRATLLRMCADPDVQFGEAYSSGAVHVDGDLGLLIEELYRHGGDSSSGGLLGVTRRAAQALHRRPSNTLEGSRQNIHHHYDIGNEFYSLWLGATMAYTCAYFPTRQATLDEAQTAKMDHVCRKLRLRPGQSVVEAGCGWGSLAVHMAQHYGVRVRAFNISREQIAYARERARAMGLDRQVEFVQDDYRNVTGCYDAFASVGMLEHVGPENYEQFGRLIHRILKPGGIGLIHSIGRNRGKPMHRWIDKRIFPGAQPPSLRQMMDIFEGCNFSVLDVENLRLHYARTLALWTELFERSVERVRRMFDERFVRMWRLYLEGSGAAFRAGELQLFQVVFAPGESNEIPWTRADLYEGEK